MNAILNVSVFPLKNAAGKAVESCVNIYVYAP